MYIEDAVGCARISVERDLATITLCLSHEDFKGRVISAGGIGKRDFGAYLEILTPTDFECGVDTSRSAVAEDHGLIVCGAVPIQMEMLR